MRNFSLIAERFLQIALGSIDLYADRRSQPPITVMIYVTTSYGER